MMIEQALDINSKPQINERRGNESVVSGSLVSRSLVREYRLEVLRQRINDDNYLHAAIQRLALVMSNELMDITQEGGHYERKRRK